METKMLVSNILFVYLYARSSLFIYLFIYLCSIIFCGRSPSSVSQRNGVFPFTGLFADGPGAYLFHGVFEQSYVFHVMDHALCLSSSKQKSCEKHVERRGA